MLSRLNSPEFVICVSHLVRSKFWHKNFDDVDKDKEVDLWKTETQVLISVVSAKTYFLFYS